MQSSIGFYQVMNLMTPTGLLRLLGPLGGEDSLPATARKLPLEAQEIYLNLLRDPIQDVTAIAELQALPQTFEQTSRMRVSERPLGSLPLIVLTAGQTTAPGSTPFDERLVPVSDQQLQYQREPAGQSSQGEHRAIDESGHLVHLDAPDEVVWAIRDMLEAVGRSK